MANFDKYTNYNNKAGVTGVVFGANAPVLEVELNELQEIQSKKIRDIVTNLFGNQCVAREDKLSYNTDTHILEFYDGYVFICDGYVVSCGQMSFEVPNGELVQVYIRFWEDTVSSNEELRELGYQQSNTIIPNYFKDSRFNVETSRRKVLKYTFATSIDESKHNFLVAEFQNRELVYTPNAVSIDSIYNSIMERIDTMNTELLTAISEAGDTSANPVFTGSVSMGRKANTTVGNGSTALGSGNTASGTNSMAVGEGNTASGMRAIALGYNNTASDGYAFAVGNNNTASGTGSVAMGYKSVASEDYAFALGNSVKSTGLYSFCIGTNNTALQNQLALGCHNNNTIATQGALSGADTGSFLVIGNGTASAKSNAFRVQGDGAVYSKGAYNATGADYAEYAEWADGNSDNEDRRGYFVTFDEEKPHMIRKAKATDIDILGVVSGNPCVIGNSDECWTKQFLTDEFGNFLYETVEEEFEFVVVDLIEHKDPETGEVTMEEVPRVEVRTLPVRRYIQNPDYDPEKEYVHRRDRKEWSAVGWVGVLPVREDGTCEVGGYCTWSDDGLATKAEPNRFNYKVLERVSDNIIKVAIK